MLVEDVHNWTKEYGQIIRVENGTDTLKINDTIYQLALLGISFKLCDIFQKLCQALCYIGNWCTGKCQGPWNAKYCWRLFVNSSANLYCCRLPIDFAWCWTFSITIGSINRRIKGKIFPLKFLTTKSVPLDPPLINQVSHYLLSHLVRKFFQATQNVPRWHIDQLPTDM